MEPSELAGQQLSLLIMSEDADDETEWPVLTGIVQQEGERLILSRPEGDFPIRPEWLSQVRPVDPRVSRVLLGADYVLPLRAGDLPASATPRQIHDLGLTSGRRREPRS